MSRQTDERPALSRRRLKALAAERVMGRELVRELERLERKGVHFRAGFLEQEGVYPQQVRYLLLGEPAEDEEGLGTKSRRDEALAQVRQDPDFMRVRVDDFSYELRANEEGRDEVYVSRWNKEILWAVTRALHGPAEPGYASFGGAYWPQEDYDNPFQDTWGHMPDSFVKELEESGLSWLDLLRHKDQALRERAVKHLGDPAQPEEIVIKLVGLRLQRVFDEYERLLKHERQRAELKATAQAEQTAAQRVDDAWSGFFAAAPAGSSAGSSPALPALDDAPPPPPPRHARGAAEMLGDLDR